MRRHPVDSRREEDVKIGDDSCLSSGNSVQQAVGKRWRSNIHLEENKKDVAKSNIVHYTVYSDKHCVYRRIHVESKQN